MRLLEFTIDELYHGTSADIESIKSFGLKPSGIQQGVYLTDNPDLAIEYAESDKDRSGNDTAYLITINVGMLDTNKMIPDYDHAGDFETEVETWIDSLNDVDQCVYQGAIPPEAISDIEEL